ncbi:hypothetical protein [Shewanella japonica]|uniref:hypothetical protein n=1 Tax=Shewanella japonica TaxID=93973 RepID=UPI000E73AA57|nr:hypothetical protein [Shewanella japonica]
MKLRHCFCFFYLFVFGVSAEEVAEIPNFIKIRANLECNKNADFNVSLYFKNNDRVDYELPNWALPQRGKLLRSNFRVVPYKYLHDYEMLLPEMTVKFESLTVDEHIQSTSILVMAGEEYEEEIDVSQYYNILDGETYFVSLVSFFETGSGDAYRAYGITSSIIVFEGKECRNLTTKEFDFMYRKNT